MASLRPRFLLISAVVIALALAAASFFFITMFERNIERRIDSELTVWGNQLAAGLTFDDKGRLLPPEPLSDPRFRNPYSGLYWQIDDAELESQLRSRSLWDYVLDLPVDDHDAGTIHVYTLAGPDNSQLYVQERSLIVATPTGSRSIRISLAIDRASLTLARDQFVQDILPYLFVLGAFLLAASAFQLSLGLKPLSRVSRDLRQIEHHPDRRLDGNYPAEISELIGAVNSLLDAKEKTIAKSRSRAADLAHGLKTPLTVLSNNAQKLREAGNNDLAEELAGLSKVMQDHIDHELARSRLAYQAGLASATANFVEILGEIQRTLAKTPKGEMLKWQMAGVEDATVQIDPHDIRELLGNIIENAVKWAESTIIIRAQRKAKILEVSVEDDGPGIQSDKIAEMTMRGKRFDESIAGTGFGLSIVKDIAENYDLAFHIQNRQESGLQVTVGLPIAGQKPPAE